jgi:hypothetical protein
MCDGGRAGDGRRLARARERIVTFCAVGETLTEVMPSPVATNRCSRPVSAFVSGCNAVDAAFGARVGAGQERDRREPEVMAIEVLPR